MIFTLQGGPVCLLRQEPIASTVVSVLDYGHVIYMQFMHLQNVYILSIMEHGDLLQTLKL